MLLVVVVIFLQTSNFAHNNKMVDYIFLTERYVDLSNAHDLPQVFQLFHPAAIYISHARNKQWNGIQEISEMMKEFFALYTTIHWHVPQYELFEQDGAIFNFTCSWLDEKNEKRSRQGRESVHFDDQGKIVRVCVYMVPQE